MRKFFVLFLRSNVSPISTIKQDRESGVVSLCWTEIPDQNMIMNLNILAATVRSFKMLIDYTLDLTPPFSPCPYTTLKRKRRQRNCFKIPTITGIVVAHVIANTPSKFFRLHLGKNLLFWLGSVSFQLFKLIFVFISLPPPPPSSSDAVFKKLTPKLSASHTSLRVKRASFWLA